MIENNYELIGNILDSPALPSRGAFPSSRSTQRHHAHASNSGGGSFGSRLINICNVLVACFGIRFGDRSNSYHRDPEYAGMLLDEGIASLSNLGDTRFSNHVSNGLAEATDGQDETHFGGTTNRFIAKRPRQPSPPMLKQTFSYVPPKRKRRLLPRIPLVLPVGDGYDQQRREKYYDQYFTSNEATGIWNGTQARTLNDVPTKQQMDKMVYLLNKIKSQAHARNMSKGVRNKQEINESQSQYHGRGGNQEHANSQVLGKFHLGYADQPRYHSYINEYWQHLNSFSCSKPVKAKVHFPQLREPPNVSDDSVSSWSVILAKVVMEWEAEIIMNLIRMQMAFEIDTEDTETFSARDRYLASARAARRLKKNKNRAVRKY